MTFKIGQIGCPERAVTEYKSTLRKIRVQRRYFRRGGRLQPHSAYLSFKLFLPVESRIISKPEEL